MSSLNALSRDVSVARSRLDLYTRQLDDLNRQRTKALARVAEAERALVRAKEALTKEAEKKVDRL